MLETLLQFDGKGLIALDDMSATEYIKYCSNIITMSEFFQLNEQTKAYMEEEYDIKVKRMTKIPQKAINKAKRLFVTDMSWLVMLEGFAISRCIGCAFWLNVNKVYIPIIYYNSFNRIANACSLNLNSILINSKEDVLLHEMIHVIRRFDNTSDCFEEAFADYKNHKPFGWGHAAFDPSQILKERRAIHDAEHRLKDVFREKADYVLIRLKYDEVYEIARTQHVADYIKNKRSLRHKIIKERLEL